MGARKFFLFTEGSLVVQINNTWLQDVAGLGNTAVVERVLDEALQKRKANPHNPVCLVIDGRLTNFLILVQLFFKFLIIWVLKEI